MFEFDFEFGGIFYDVFFCETFYDVFLSYLLFLIPQIMDRSIWEKVKIFLFGYV